jgi:hypothetical protein
MSDLEQPTASGAGNSSKQFRIPADKVKATIEDLPEAERAVVWWFYQYCRRKDLDRKALSRTLKKPGTNDYYSYDSITALLSGGRIRRGENVTPMIDAIKVIQKIEEARGEQKTSRFVQTRLHREIEKRALKALTRQRFMFLFGDSQIGKTYSLQEIARSRPDGQVIYVEMPTGGSLGAFLKVLARTFGIPPVMDRCDLTERLFACFDPNMQLIIDEAHRCLTSRYSISGLAVFSFLRELWNRKQVSQILSFTNEGRDKLLKGPHAKSLEQLLRRGFQFQLPAVTPDDDAALFAEEFGLPPAPEELTKIKVSVTNSEGMQEIKTLSYVPLALQRQVIREDGLGRWIDILEDASDLARETDRPISWGAVIRAYAEFIAAGEMID